MIDIKTIASSSKGCCYLIESDGEQLLIECGVTVNKIRQSLNFDFSKVVGCLVSHEHADHAEYLPELEKSGIQIYCTGGTKTRFNLSLCHDIKHKEFLSNCGKFHVMPVKLWHNVDCFGFLIMSGSETLLYATDTGSVNYQISGLTHVMIEANHIFEKLLESESNRGMISRVSENHLDIDSVVDFCSRHRETLEEIHLIHLSDSHSDENLFKSMVMDATGVPVIVAEK